MKKEEKSQIVETIFAEVSARPHLYITDIAGLNAADTSKLRRLCFKKNVKLIMVKNTLLRKALEKTEVDFSELFPTMKGTTAIMLSDINNAPAQLIQEFRKASEKPLLKGAYVEESFYVGDNTLETLAHIKSKSELIGEVIGLLQSPLQGVLGALESAPRTLAGVVKTLSERAE
ncbi:MAG: 50S ribosomal protein L10 [Bacteroidales bacterium]|nr:50S ribosomal protein L10 [Bacteroidales bacterium]